MAEEVQNSAEELSQIQSILDPLNKNPLTSEDLNPMAGVFRKKMGFAEPIVIGADESEEEEQEEEEETAEEAPPPPLEKPPAKKFDADDDIDLDELLNEEEETGAEATPEPVDEFPSFDTEDLTTPEADEFADLGGGAEPEATAEFDPFADLGGAAEPAAEAGAEASDEFADFGGAGEAPEAESEFDPFADLGGGAEPEAGPGAVDESVDEFADFGGEAEATEPAEFDPFADLGGETTAETDPFADLGGEATAATDPFADLGGGTEAETDAFADLGGEAPETEAEFDPFADLGGGAGETETDPFADLGGSFETESSAAVAEPFDDFSSAEPVHSDEDPFADFSSGGSGELADDFSTFAEEPGATGGSFDDFAPNIDTYTEEVDVEEALPESGLEDDLSSLASEDEVSIEEGLTDEDLAVIQQQIIKYPPKLKRIVIDAIVNDRISKSSQKELLELVKSEQKPQDIATFLSALLGYKVLLADESGTVSPEGIPIISANPLYTKAGLLRRRKLIKQTVFGSAAVILLIAGLLSGYKYLWKPFQAADQYETGLSELFKARDEKDPVKRQKLFASAELFFGKGEKIDPNNLKYLNRYSIAYMKAGEYSRSFEKLFGVVTPDFGMETTDPEQKGSWSKRKEVPYISLADGDSWNDLRLSHGGRMIPPENQMTLVSQDKVKRKIIKAGAYIAMRLAHNIHDNETYINLGRFHSGISPSFVDPEQNRGAFYKNDDLAISYYKQVFTDGNSPHDSGATAGIAKIYYNKKEYAKAASYYNKIIEKFPNEPVGHTGLLSTYIQMWKNDNNPVFVINHHRQVRNALEIEDKLPIYILNKLASFYIDLDSNDLRIKYNVNPVDQVTALELDDNVEHLLNLAYNKEEDFDGETVKGSENAENYYQRGRFFLKHNETRRALKMFELAANYDTAHYEAVVKMAEYYINVADYNEAMALLSNAAQRFETYKNDFGVKEDDETLIEGDTGAIFFDMGKIIYLTSAGVEGSDNILVFPGKKVYPERSLGKLSEDNMNRRKELANSVAYFEKAREFNLKDPLYKRQMTYFRGWIEFMQSNYNDALMEWSDMPETDAYANPQLLLGKADAFYYTRQYNASLGNYLRLKDDYEEKMAMIGEPLPDEKSHQEIYQTLTAVYNNIGAVYEMKGNQIEALKYYWKAIETARKIQSVSEISISNKDLVLRPGTGREPLLEDWLPPYPDTN